MERFIAIAAAALTLSAGAVSAQQVNPGLQQIADFLGVDAGAYSQAELHQLLNARSTGDQTTYAWLLSHGDAAAQSDVVSAGKEQLAAQAGVNAADFTTAEINQIRNAQLSGDAQALSFYLNHENRNTINNAQPVLGSDA